LGSLGGQARGDLNLCLFVCSMHISIPIFDSHVNQCLLIHIYIKAQYLYHLIGAYIYVDTAYLIDQFSMRSAILWQVIIERSVEDLNRDSHSI
jgi:hypothetical protein